MGIEKRYFTVKNWLTIILCFFCFLNSKELHTQSPAQSPRIANYKMEVDLLVNEKRLKVKQQLNWTNSSMDTITEMYFHLYYNAFKNSESTFFKERGVPSFLTNDIDENCGWSWSHVAKIIDPDGNDLSPSIEFVATDDDNHDDQSVMRIELAKPLLPMKSIDLDINWEAKIPKTMPRTGYNKDYYFFAQWFPKVGVYERSGIRSVEEGHWNCHQYHSSGEYYADFGVYDVNITVPSDFVVAASGQLVNKIENGDNTTWNYLAEDVIDFSWACSPHFSLLKDQHNDTEIKLYCYPYKEHVADRYFTTIKFGMQYLQEHLGPYPYPSLSIIDTPIHGMFTGGMEYPNLVTSLSFCFFPKGFRTPETLVIHEYIHQYFMQMVATHEVEDPWMDEGLTTYYEGRIMDSLFNLNNSTIDLLGFKVGNQEYNRIEFLASANPKIASNVIKSWEYKHGGYGSISYNKTALWLKTMEGILGINTMDLIMRTYFESWKFKHPGRQDFIDIVNKLVIEKHGERFPDGFDWYFEQVLYGTETCDYSVASISNNELENKRGFFNDLDNCEMIEQQSNLYDCSVIFHRLGEVWLPQDLKLNFEDGSFEMYHWNGKDRSHEIRFMNSKKVISAEIDPNRKVYIDTNFLNNSKTIEKRKSTWCKLLVSFATAIQNVLETTALLA